MRNLVKYPRSFHLPWSLGATDDDKTLANVDHFVGKEVVITEKVDGENTTLHPDAYCHARSLDSASHESQAWVRALAATMVGNLPANWRVCGENVYAKHTLAYEALSSYFLTFSIWDGDVSLSWDDVVAYSEMLGLHTVPVLYRGIWDEAAVKACYTGVSVYGGIQEGYVVRVADSFNYADFSNSLAKFVRADHVDKDSKHWRTQKVIPNKLV